MPKIRDPAADCPNRGRRLSRRGRYNPEQDRRADPFFVVNCSTVLDKKRNPPHPP
jgi:hypothetical protein